MIKRICLIDGDVLKYSCGFSVEKTDESTGIIYTEPLQNAIWNIKSIINKCILNVSELEKYNTDYKVYLTDSSKEPNFRVIIDSNYKANRKGLRKPIYFEKLHNYLVQNGALETSGQEADDSITIDHTFLRNKGELEPVICSIDKDFNTVPGVHYNWRKNSLYNLTELEAMRNFYLQILTGDRADNIPRIKKGWRSKPTKLLLDKVYSEKEMLDIIEKECHNVFKDDISFYRWPRQWITTQGQLVYLRRKPNEMWSIKDEQ